MTHSRISLVLPATKLVDLLKTLEGEYTDLHVEPVEADEVPAKPKAASSRGGPYMSTNLVKLTLGLAQGLGEVKVSDLGEHFADNGKSENSVSATLSNLKFLGVISVSEDKMSFRVREEHNWRKYATKITYAELADLRKLENQA